MAQIQRELSVKVDVDIAEAIRGLKAVQREAKKATQALAELQAQEVVITREEDDRLRVYGERMRDGRMKITIPNVEFTVWDFRNADEVAQAFNDTIAGHILRIKPLHLQSAEYRESTARAIAEEDIDDE